MTDQLPPWVPLAVALLLVVMSIVPVVAKLIPTRDAPPKTASDAWPVSVQALQHRLHEEAPAPTYCCDQGEIAWPYPCPWHGEHAAWTTKRDAFVDAVLDHLASPMKRGDS